MTYPSGGFPSQGPQHQPPPPQQGGQFYQQPPQQGGGRTLDTTLIAYLAVAGLGVLNLFFGFATLARGANLFEAFSGWVPGLLFIAGLTAAFGVLPGDHKPGAWPAVFSLGAAIPFLFFVFSTDADLKTGGTLVLIFGLVQAAVAVGAYLLDVGIVKLPQPGQKQPAYGQPGQQSGQPGQPGQPGYGQQGQFGQYGQPQGGFQQPVQPHAGQTQPAQPHTPPPGQPPQGAPGQPGQGQGQPGQPVNQQQSGQAPTLYASPQGQFTQQPPQQG